MRRLFRLAGREPAPSEDVAREVDAHLAMKVERLMVEGWSRAAAEQEAARQFGSRAEFEHRTRAVAEEASRRRRWRDRRGSWSRELGLAFRSLRRAPGYTAAATIVLALGIGASLAVLAVADRLLLRPLSYPDADRLFVLLERRVDGGLRLPSYPTVQDWQAQAPQFDGIAYVPGTQLRVRAAEGAETVLTAFPTAQFFSIMGTDPLLGRTLTLADETQGARVAVLSYPFWQRRFGGSRQVIGTSLALADGAATVVGVMPLGFRFPEWADLYLPISTIPPTERNAISLRGNHADSRVVARLKLGVTAAAGAAGLNVVAQRLAREYPVEQEGWTTIPMVGMRDYLYNPQSFGGTGLANPIDAVRVFLGAVLLVLLIACANVACLTLVRGQVRTRELGIRAALGANRWQLVRQLFIESTVLAGLAAGVGLAVAGWLIDGVRRAAPDLVPRLAEVRIDPRLAGAAIGLAALSAVLTGLVPALRATPRSLSGLLTAGGHQRTSSKDRLRAQRALVAIQIGLAVTLAVGATLLVKSLIRVIDTPLGFDPEGLLTATISPDERKYHTPAAYAELYGRLATDIARIPGVGSVAITNHTPVSGASMPARIMVDGYEPPAGQEPAANFRLVSPNYFATMRIPILRGESFADADLPIPTGRILVNQSLAQRYWPNVNPIGKRLTVFKAARWSSDFGQPVAGVVVGVVGDVRHFGAETAVPDEVYLPYTWNPWSWTGVVIRAAGDPNRLVDPVRRVLAAADPDLPVRAGASPSVGSFAVILRDSRAPRQLMTTVAAGLGGAALLLAVVGLYSLMAYVVGLRRREIGIRTALGASRAAVLRLIMGQGIRLAASGAGVGLVGAWVAAHLLQTLVFSVSVHDLVVFLSVPAALMAVALAATYLPARRAAGVDPVEVLKGE